MLSLFLLLAVASSADVIQPSLPLETTLQPGESKTFEIHPNSQDFIQVVAEGQAATLTITLRQSQTTLAQASSLGGTGGPATISALAPTNEILQLEVHRLEKKGPSTSITIQSKTTNPATDQNQTEAQIYTDWLQAKTVAQLNALRLKSASISNTSPLTLALAAAEVRAKFTAADYSGGLELAESQLPLAQSANNQRMEVFFHYWAGLCQILMEKHSEAAREFETALALDKPLNQPSELGAILQNLASAHFVMGNCDQSLDEAQQALEIRRTLGDPAREAYSMLAIAKAHVCLGNAQQALDGYNAVLPLWRQLKDQSNEAASLNDMGVVFLSLGDTEQAHSSYLESLRIREKIADVGGQGETLVNLGSWGLITHQYNTALGFFERALELPGKGEYKRRLGYATEGKGEALFHLGHKQEADNLFHQSLDLLAQTEDHRAEAFTYRMLGEADQSLDYLQRAVTIAQKAGDQISQAVSLTQLGRLQLKFRDFPTARLTLNQAVTIIEATRASLSDARLRMDYLAARRDAYELQLEALSQSGAANTEDAFLISERAHGRTLLDSIGSRTDATSRLARLADVQSTVLDSKTALLEYFLGDRRSWLWLVTHNSFHSYPLPRRAVLESLIRRYYTALTARSLSLPNETLEQHFLRIRTADADQHKIAAQLSAILLGPIETRIKGRRLLIADDGFLRLAPFSTLVPGVDIVLVPSASYLAEAYRTPAANLANEKMLILADPVFDASDPRVSPPQTSAGEFPRLPQTRTEANLIANLRSPSQVEEKLDFDASLNALRKAGQSNFGVIHIATHTVVDNQRLEMSALILSLVNKDGKPQPGILRLRDIYDLHLQTGLVTLSSCESGLGRELGGEGMIGLSHALLFAGAKRVVASLWKVEDSATSKLMQSFYLGVLKRNLPPAAALRAAQSELRSDPRWQAPYYWAAFVIEGDGR